jgi:hypothetical protein
MWFIRNLRAASIRKKCIEHRREDRALAQSVDRILTIVEGQTTQMEALLKIVDSHERRIQGLG